MLPVVGVYVGYFYGFNAIISHFSLRLILSTSGYLPGRLVKFFQYASDLILLRQVGGGFDFIHPYLLDYFANMEETGAIVQPELQTAWTNGEKSSILNIQSA